MTLARLLAATLLLSSLPALAQDQTQDQTKDANQRIGNQWKAPATSSDPWQLLSSEPAEPGFVVSALDPSRLDQYRYDQLKADGRSAKSPFDISVSARKPRQDSDITCLKIRSYVVARDDRNSDSTHMVSYSTCQPAERYGLKTTDLRIQTGGR